MVQSQSFWAQSNVLRTSILPSLPLPQAKTDDDVGDEAVGAARAAFAEKSRKRREAEQSKIAAENAGYQAGSK